MVSILGSGSCKLHPSKSYFCTLTKVQNTQANTSSNEHATRGMKGTGSLFGLRLFISFLRLHLYALICTYHVLTCMRIASASEAQECQGHNSSVWITNRRETWSWPGTLSFPCIKLTRFPCQHVAQYVATLAANGCQEKRCEYTHDMQCDSHKRK